MVTDPDISTSSSTSSSFFEIYNDENRCNFSSRLDGSSVYNYEPDSMNEPSQQYVQHRHIQSPYTEIESLKPNEVVFQHCNEQRQNYFIIKIIFLFILELI